MKSFILFMMAPVLCAQMNTIEGSRIRPHVKFLSSDLLEGRGVGQRGGQLAVEYIAAQFAAAGLKPGGDAGTYLQKVPLRTVEMLPGAALTATGAGKSLSFKWLDDFVGTSPAQEAKAAFDAGVVFVGHGIKAPEFGWDDYKGVDVHGKVVVLFTNEPPSEDPAFFGGKALTYYGRWTYKFEEAARQGAAAAILIHTTATASYGWPVVRANGRPQPQVQREGPALAFAGWITSDAGARLLALSGLTVEGALAEADKKGFKPRPLEGLRVALQARCKVTGIETHNVVGYLPGSDPALSKEAVVYTAHWDHLGLGEPVKGDAIYNGALDNATGTAVLIEMARAWSTMEPKPLRSAWFVAVTAEESGLLGSHYFAEHPPVPAERIAVNLNFDSFSPYGRVKDVILTGAERTTFFPLVEAALERHRLTLKVDSHPESGGYFRSDHYSFARLGVPAFSVNMGSDYEGKPAGYAAEIGRAAAGRYHQPSDEYQEDWDFSGMEQFAKFGLALGVDVANLPKIPGRIKAK